MPRWVCVYTCLNVCVYTHTQLGMYTRAHMSTRVCAMAGHFCIAIPLVSTFCKSSERAGTFCESIGTKYWVPEPHSLVFGKLLESHYIRQGIVFHGWCDGTVIMLQKTSGWRSDTFIAMLWSTGMFWCFYKKYRRRSIAIQKCPSMVCALHRPKHAWKLLLIECCRKKSKK